MKKSIWWKEHLLSLAIGISALIQLIVLFYFQFGTGSSSTKNYIPMTILPYVESMKEVKPRVEKKVIQEVSAEEATDTQEENQTEEIQNTTTQQSVNQEPNFMPFVRVDEIAKSLVSLQPEYPDLARNAGIEGTVVLEVYIDEDGRVRKVIVLKGIGFGCDEAAVRKVESSSFIPAKMNGKPVAVRQKITFEFKLN
ncbi:MAG TPA: hypothetical protein DHW82_12770 [Spirochaetia bacterium]|nr:MAG: hypothetical protein A2Y41_03230 [Spirochaetes bacterium GWB1_36_13]HCL57862.1 hypothetical protein [Spirochaetia bacterium]